MPGAVPVVPGRRDLWRRALPPRDAVPNAPAQELHAHTSSRDGDAGRICDVCFDVPGWDVRDLVVRTTHYCVLLAPTAVAAIDTATATIATRLIRDEVTG